MNIAIFGGRFDPVHNGHMAIAQEILQQKKADEVWMSIENLHQWRPIIASSKDRKTMVHSAIEREPYIKVDSTPIQLGGVTETITVMREIRKKFPENSYFFVCGSDQLPNFPKWTHWEQLQKEVTFLVVPRKGSPFENVPANCIVLDDVDYEPLEDSATRIRSFLKEGKSITRLVPEEVEKYIVENELYK